MTALSISIALGFTIALVFCLLGLVWRMIVWIRTPSPVPIPLAPAPRTRCGVMFRLAAEMLLFRSLARASVSTWVSSLLMHYGLLFVLVAHLQLMVVPLPNWLLLFVQISGWAAFACVAGLLMLAGRRILIKRVRRVSAPSDFLHLVLLLAIVLSGVALKRYWPVDVAAVGEFLRGVLTLDWQPLPVHAVLVAHLIGVLLLLLIFPISKLVHAPGIAFAPTFNQREPSARVRRQKAR